MRRLIPFVVILIAALPLGGCISFFAGFTALDWALIGGGAAVAGAGAEVVSTGVDIRECEQQGACNPIFPPLIGTMQPIPNPVVHLHRPKVIHLHRPPKHHKPLVVVAAPTPAPKEVVVVAPPEPQPVLTPEPTPAPVPVPAAEPAQPVPPVQDPWRAILDLGGWLVATALIVGAVAVAITRKRKKGPTKTRRR